MSAELNVETGLPALPEGYRWQIDTRGYHEEQLIIQIAKRGADRIVHRTDVYTTRKVLGFLPYTTRTPQSDLIQEVWNVEVGEFVREENLSRAWVTRGEALKDITEQEKQDGWEVTQIAKNGEWIYVLTKNTVTPELILKTAERLLARFEVKEQKRKAEEEATAYAATFVGTYPPKKLEV